MNNYDDEMWNDYDHYQNTGELSEYFEGDEEQVTDEPNRPSPPYDTFCIADDDVEQILDDVIRYLENQIKEKEKIIKSKNKSCKWGVPSFEMTPPFFVATNMHR